nr:MAG TPA: hypothetical protein [Caudoviricetes sp.]
MDNRILTIDSLIDYCKKNKLSHYSSKESGKPIVVNTFGNISYSESSDPSLMAVTLKACHCGINRNNSKITEKVMKKAFPTFANKPILAEIVESENGEKDFGSHSFTIESDENGNEYTHYIEKPVGIVPETNDIHLEYDESQDKTYTIVNGYIFNYYGNETADIIKRKNGTKVSVELEIYDMAWSGKDKVLVINDFSFAGITLLGESVGEGMLGSRLDIADFSKKETIDYSEQLIEMQERLKKLETACFNNINNNGKEETIEVDKEKFEEEVTETVEVTEKEETTEEEVTVTENESEETVDETSEETTGEEISEENTETITENESNTVEYSFVSNGEVKKFAVSLQDKIYAIQDLANATYAEADNTYYGVTVYDEYVIMCDRWSGRYYKQSYDSNDDNYSLTGDRVEVYVDFVTADEQKELESMRSNYAALKEFKETAEKNELRAQKEAIINTDNYSVLTEKDSEGNYVNADFAELVKTMDNYSVEDFETKVKVMHSDYMSAHANFSSTGTKKNTNSVKMFTNVNSTKKKNNRYGNLKFN